MAKDRAPAADEGLNVRIAWQRDDPALEADAIAFWERLGVLPAGVAPAQRAKELAAGVYKDGALVAVATAVPHRIDFLRANFLQLRSMADPSCPREDMQAAFADPVRKTLEAWAVANPEQGLAGVVTFVDPKAVGELAHMPVWPIWPLSLVGYLADGRQVRVCWFDHFLFD